MVTAAKSRATATDLPFCISPDYLMDHFSSINECPILGIKFDWLAKKQSHNSPSLDRIVQEKGYVEGNVQLISRRANVMKNDSSIEELKLFAKWINSKFGDAA